MRYAKMITGFIALAMFVIVGYAACIKDKCGNTICDNGGVCVQGKCACPAGYEGDFCQRRWNEKFEGSWQADDSLLRIATHKKYALTIESRGIKDSFYVTGFIDTMKDVLCVKSTHSKFTFIADRRLDSTLTFKSGAGYVDSINGGVKGAYILQKKLATKDSLMTVYFSWKRL